MLAFFHTQNVNALKNIVWYVSSLKKKTIIEIMEFSQQLTQPFNISGISSNIYRDPKWKEKGVIRDFQEWVLGI